MSYKFKKAETKPPTVVGANRFAQMAAKNDTQSSEMLFERRKHYRDTTFKTEFERNKNPINFWELRMGNRYGKVDFNGDPVYINEYFLKQYKTEKTVFGLAPVVDAFEDMVNYMENYKLALGNRTLSPDSVYKSFKAAKGWVSTNEEYSKYLQNVAQSFVKSFLTPRREKEILNFESFLKLYLESMTGLTKGFPLSLSGFIRSKYCNHRTSGLIIDLYEPDYSIDRIKEGFLKDGNFNFFLEMAEKFGFFVDKNCPWRLTANITRSMPMAKRMSRHGIPYPETGQELEGLNKVFERFYRSAYDVEMPILKHYLVEMYNNYVISRPTIAAPQLKQCYDRQTHNYKKTTTVKTILRQPEKCFVKRQLDPNSAYAQKYGELFWIRFYYYLRMLEERQSITEQKLNHEFRQRIQPYYRVHGLVPTIRGINRELTLNLRVF